MTTLAAALIIIPWTLTTRHLITMAGRHIRAPHQEVTA